MDPVMFSSSFFRILTLFLKMIDATPENLTTSITISPTMLTVSNGTEQTVQEGTSYFPYETPIEVYTAYVMETTMHSFNKSDSDQPKTTLEPFNLNESVIFQFHSEAVSNVPLPDLYIGIKADVLVKAIYPSGFYNEIIIKVDASHDKLLSPHFELLSMSCQSGTAIQVGDDGNLNKESKY